MNSTPTCPLCSNLVLRHIRSKNMYWYCQHCHQEVPILDEINCIRPSKQRIDYRKLELLTK